MEQEEGVLKDVLDELDRERTRRAELELQVQQLEQENQRLRLEQHDQFKKEQTVSYGDFTAMQTEVKGYRELIDALTLGKPAIAAAAQAEHVREASTRRAVQQQNNAKSKDETVASKTLPLHIVRLLEVLPWEDRAKQHVVVVEQIFEWQVYKEQSWQSQWKYFPTLFKTLRSHGSENNHNNAFLQMVSGADLNAKRNKQQRILTDEKLSILYDTDSEFPLPTDGGVWEWIGSWRIQKDHEDVPSDANGWSYVEEPRDFASHNSETSTVFNDPGINVDEKSKTLVRPFRRRKWIRQRNLVNYPLASESTQQYLRLLADTARMQIVTAKINDQLIETKATLTETEERLVKAKNDGVAPSSTLPSEEIVEEQHDTKKLEQELVGGESTTSIEGQRTTPIFDRHQHPMDKISMWVQQHHHASTRKASEDITLSDDSGTEDGLGTDSTHSDSTTRSPNTSFDWKKLGRHQIMQKLKRNHGSNRRGKTFRTPIVLDTPEEDDDLML